MTECVFEFKLNEEEKIQCKKFLSHKSSSKKKNEKKLYKLLAELVDTERAYVEDLEEVIIAL
jgi:hypothetical protein